MADAGAITRQIAEFAAGAPDIPSSVRDRGAVHFLDALGLALAGFDAPPSRIAREHALAQGAAGRAMVLGAAARTSPRLAAFANATAMHADNFDDTNPQAAPDRNGGVHATVPVLAAALAVAEAEGRDGAALAEAAYAGIEIACRLNHAIGRRHYESGFHPTGTLTVFGAAAAAGRLMGLDADGIGNALACAASMSSGIRRNFGSHVEPLHAGHAAECGVAAAELARLGLEGPADILEGASGFFSAAGDGVEAGAIEGRLGAPWAFDDPGMWIKPFPSGALTHPAVTWILDARRDRNLGADQVRALRVRTNARIAATLIHNNPKTALEAKFSMPFCVAIALIEGRLGLTEFTDASVARDDVRGLMGRIDYAPFAKAEPDYANTTTLIDIDLADGTTLSGRADFGLGSSRRPMEMADVTEKFVGCALYAGWGEERARRAAKTLSRLEDFARASDIADVLAP